MSALIVNSGCANISSVKFALERLGETVKISDDPHEISSANKVILPGVGSIDFAMMKLEKKGLVNCLKSLTQPTLGICLGMQILYENSDEGQKIALGIAKGKALEFPKREGLPVPHMGWNNLTSLKDNRLLFNVPDGSYFYYVHSYFIPLGDETIASCNYGQDFTAIFNEKNYYGCQFHPERSGEMGAKILKNFLELK